MKKKIFTDWLLGLTLWILTIVLPFWLIIPMLIIRINQQIGGITINNYVLTFLGWICFAVGFAIANLVMYKFASEGQATPAPYIPPHTLVTGGIFMRSRNPMYLGYFLVYLSLFLISGVFLLFVYFLLALVGFWIYVVKVEEPKLHRRFGLDYDAYCKHVPRWI
jgi:protein-S-isoprenylcysteine O-methyltransferase Ste14